LIFLTFIFTFSSLPPSPSPFLFHRFVSAQGSCWKHAQAGLGRTVGRDCTGKPHGDPEARRPRPQLHHQRRRWARHPHHRRKGLWFRGQGWLACLGGKGIANDRDDGRKLKTARKKERKKKKKWLILRIFSFSFQVLEPGNEILEVNGTLLAGKTHEQAVDLLKNSGSRVKLLVRRKKK
jgi:hypothetical protein